MTGSERSNKGGKKPAEIFFAFNTFLWLFHPKRNTTEVQHKDAHLTDSSKVAGGIMHTKYEQTFQTPERNDDDDGGGWKKSWVLVFVALKPELI